MSARARDESFLTARLASRGDALRRLSRAAREGGESGAASGVSLVDFTSNDYLGLARTSASWAGRRDVWAMPPVARPHGSTGSRLLSGNSRSHERAECELAAFYGSEAALLFNSGYDANIGLLQAVARRGDTIVYDELAHASVRDGARLSLARSFAFRHNDAADLIAKLKEADAAGERFVVVESIYSMDGDLSPLKEMVAACRAAGAHLIVDEAHASGVFGPGGTGLVVASGVEHEVFARVHTFGKALGCHGAAVVGSDLLRQTLINFARSFIYTTALPPSAVEVIRRAHEVVAAGEGQRGRLMGLIGLFSERVRELGIRGVCTVQPGPIQVVHVAGNERCRRASERMAAAGLDVRAILSPTVREGSERLRVCLHSTNTAEEVEQLVGVMGAIAEQVARV